MIVHSETVDPNDACHGCGNAMTEADQPSYFGDTCRTCVNECLCFLCCEARAELAEDRAVELHRMAWGERDD